MQRTINSVLIIRFSSVGDVVLSSLLVRTLRARFPSSQIDYVVKEEFADLVRHSPYLNNVISLPRNGTFDNLRAIRQRIRLSSYDLVLDIHGSLRSRFLCAGMRNVRRIRKRTVARFLLVNFKLNVYERFGGSPSVALRYLETAHAFGVQDDGKGLDLFIRQDDALRAAQVIEADGFGQEQRFIALCPSARHANKMWPAEGFAEVGAELERNYGHPVLVFGSNDECKYAAEVANSIQRRSPGVRVLNLAGRLSLSETAAAMDRCVVVVTNDSGLMHIAAARKRNVVAIFGPTVKELGFFPFGTQSIVVERRDVVCRPCTSIGLPVCPKKHFRCMNEITPHDVVKAAMRFLS